jgi:hypothetical protein
VQSLVDELGAEVERECRRIYAVSSTKDTREKVKAALGLTEAQTDYVRRWTLFDEPLVPYSSWSFKFGQVQV